MWGFSVTLKARGIVYFVMTIYLTYSVVICTILRWTVHSCLNKNYSSFVFSHNISESRHSRSTGKVDAASGAGKDQAKPLFCVTEMGKIFTCSFFLYLFFLISASKTLSNITIRCRIYVKMIPMPPQGPPAGERSLQSMVEVGLTCLWRYQDRWVRWREPSGAAFTQRHITGPHLSGSPGHRRRKVSSLCRPFQATNVDIDSGVLLSWIYSTIYKQEDRV